LPVLGYFIQINHFREEFTRMSKVAVVTDSTASIPAARLKGLPIKVAPLQVIWDNQTYLDSIDITPEQFYTRLQSSATMPTTSQTTPGTFQEIYKSLLDEGYDVISVHISSKLSGTMDSAIQAKAAINSDRIELVDSETIGMSLGFTALNVAKAAVQGGKGQRPCRCLFPGKHARIFAPRRPHRRRGSLPRHRFKPQADSHRYRRAD
jgi:hypothetical protein